MPIEETRVTNWDDFLKEIKPYVPDPTNQYGRIGFRGQEIMNWGLRPSLARYLPPECDLGNAIEIERKLLIEFRMDGHRNLPNCEIPDPHYNYSLLCWLAVMQQYGAPTRLLDWTFSPYVAAYFAVRAEPDDDGAVWVLQDYESFVAALRTEPKTEVSLIRINQTLANGVAEPSVPPGICANFIQMQRPERMYAQQGFYMVCEDPRRGHAEVMEEIREKAGSKPFLRKIVIPSKEKVQFLANLRMMNITGASLFPGADGLGRHVAELAKLVANKLAIVPSDVSEGTTDSDVSI